MNRTSSIGRKPSRTRISAIAHVGGAALVLAAVAVPLRASHAQGISLAIPSNAPSLLSFQAAAIGTNNPVYATDYGLVPLTDAAGNEVTVATATGVGGTAYLDPVGNVIVAYAWDETPAEDNLSTAIISGYGPSAVPGYGDAVTFLKTAEAAAAAKGVPVSKIYLTGFSLGAMLASYVGSQTGLPGIGYAACGVPDYTAPATVANNFISFVEANDPVAQYGTDTLESASSKVANPHMDHYGTVIVLEAPGAEELQFTSNITGFTLPEFFAGTLPVPADQVAVVEGEYYDLLTPNHQMNLYNPDTYTLARSYGIDPAAP